MRHVVSFGEIPFVEQLDTGVNMGDNIWKQALLDPAQTWIRDSRRAWKQYLFHILETTVLVFAETFKC